jgi:hypothetical protein
LTFGSFLLITETAQIIGLLISSVKVVYFDKKRLGRFVLKTHLVTLHATWPAKWVETLTRLIKPNAADKKADGKLTFILSDTSDFHGKLRGNIWNI